jgi:hypothetical protein
MLSGQFALGDRPRVNAVEVVSRPEIFTGGAETTGRYGEPPA